MTAPRHPSSRVARWGRLAALGASAVLVSGCSVKQLAIRQLGSALADGAEGAFAAEEDIEFAGQALPFSLKLVESLLHEQPENIDLLLAAASGFTQYAFVWVQQPGDFAEAENFAEAQRQRDRARRFYLRAHRYAGQALEARHPGIGTALERDPRAALDSLQKADVPLLYWSALSLGGALSLGKTDPELIARRPLLEALVDRAAALDPEWGAGAVQELLMNYELSRGGGTGSVARTREYFERALALSGGRRVSPLVGFAEAVSVQQQNKGEFVRLLEQALALDPDRHPELRLANTVMQERARWLLGRVDELFLE